MIVYEAFLYKLGEPTIVLAAGRDSRPARNLAP